VLPTSNALIPLITGGQNYSFDLTAFVRNTVTDLTQYVKLTGSTWPDQDLTYYHVQHGQPLAPLAFNAGPANFFTPFRVDSYFAAGHIGGAQGGFFQVQVRGAPDSSSTNQNYGALVGFTSVTSALGGTGLTMATSKGQIFGQTSIAVLYPGATNIRNVTGGEINVQCNSGSSTAYKCVLQLVGTTADAVSGSVYDCGLSFSNQAGAVGFNVGILFSGANGQQFLKSTGTIFSIADSPTFANGFDLSGATLTGFAYKSNQFIVDNAGNISGLTLTASGATPTVSAGQVAIGTTTATAATAGTHGDVPAQVLGYLVMNLGGTPIKVPYYAA
jgi:predicted heme/steroid binding protein